MIDQPGFTDVWISLASASVSTDQFIPVTNTPTTKQLNQIGNVSVTSSSAISQCKEKISI